MQMMIPPPTGSPSTIEIALAARRIRTSGSAKEHRSPDQRGEPAFLHQAVRAVEAQSLSRFVGTQSCPGGFKQIEEVSDCMSQKQSRVPSLGCSLAALSLRILHAQGGGRASTSCTAHAKCPDVGLCPVTIPAPLGRLNRCSGDYPNKFELSRTRYAPPSRFSAGSALCAPGVLRIRKCGA